ncbi:MAG: hypothetical protein LBG10_07355, partial [Treponema sp.]|nr:hypothetical protein [Treponema sp.]
MNALTVLFAGRLASQAWEPVFSGQSALALALEQARKFPGAAKIVLLGREGEDYSGLGPQVETALRPQWTKKSFLESLSALSRGFDLTYIAWADCPFLDPGLAGAVAERHIRYGAEYSYADGWPTASPRKSSPPAPRESSSKFWGMTKGRWSGTAFFRSCRRTSTPLT